MNQRKMIYFIHTQFLLPKRTAVKVKAFGKDFLPSETVSATFIKNGKAIKKIQFSKPNESYANAKADILNDNIGGIVNYRSGHLAGLRQRYSNIYIDLEKKETINTILISLLQDENSWIFLPEQIFVYYYDDKQKNLSSRRKRSFYTEARLQSNAISMKLKPGSNDKRPKIENGIASA